ncbi:hypothetical protein [Microbacter margulisiae]|uniref:Beta-galactosidase trimerisation domain-containing protein n=1 Tax=Microbacter margulisiae TaxID=1350067 RepID=A0A7W5DUY6_9PORP|nr:hypothetical protein [Microbacter margulisiae]MBB3188653.1 hypothetical protein [Microbacter margulisiae]
MIIRFFYCLLLLIAFPLVSAQSFSGRSEEVSGKTAFQTSSIWLPQIDIRSDIAIVYGANDRPGLTFEQRLQSWKDHQYQTQFMTGIAWGDYKDYYLGKWDGKNHMNVAQVQQNGDAVSHGEYNPYVVPIDSYLDYFKKEIIKKVIDAGIHSIFLEEPEFWAKSGYSDVFKKEWQRYYGFPWRAQDQSAENTYLSNKLKYHLYYHAIQEVSSYAKAYGKSKGVDVKVYIATHSLVNYSSWEIVSPEASLASLPSIDGYIAQVWTGTSRTPTYYNGIEKERTFENAFLEYGSMVSMTAPTHRTLFFLTDPIEDWPRDWSDYKHNYEATFTAELLYPMINHYEVMPWPERIYTHTYKLPNSNKEVLIPRYYSTQIQVMINALNNMPLSGHKVNGSQGIGVLMCNSLMFQRFPEHDGYTDPQFSNFYGQTFPLLKRGIPVQLVHLENLGYPESLQHIKVLIMSYSNMKPMTEKSHQYLAAWVKAGGVLIYCGRDNDPYQNVMEWWNTGKNHFKAPSEQLFKLMNLNPELRAGQYHVGKGMVYVIRQDPKEFVLQHDGDIPLIATAAAAYKNATQGRSLIFKDNFCLERGPYDIVAVMKEGVDTNPYVVQGPVIDLFNPKLPVLQDKVVEPGSEAFLYDLKRIRNKKHPQVLATAARIYKEVITPKSYSFLAKSPLNTTNSMRILLPQKPVSILVQNVDGQIVSNIETSWDPLTKTCWMSFDNNPQGIHVTLKW